MKTVVLFTAEWCESCKNIKKTLKGIQWAEYDVCDVDKDPDMARELGIRGLPTLYNRVTEEILVGNASPKQLKMFFS